jgi:predicted transcriptional regulator of viral defense system
MMHMMTENLDFREIREMFMKVREVTPVSRLSLRLFLFRLNIQEDLEKLKAGRRRQLPTVHGVPHEYLLKTHIKLISIEAIISCSKALKHMQMYSGDFCVTLRYSA